VQKRPKKRGLIKNFKMFSTGSCEFQLYKKITPKNLEQYKKEIDKKYSNAKKGIFTDMPLTLEQEIVTLFARRKIQVIKIEVTNGATQYLIECKR
jgi:hypothetical protein